VCVARSRIGPGSPDSAAGTPASKLCSPRESVRTTTGPWPGHDRQAGALLGFSRPLRSPFGSHRVQSPLESAPAVPWVRSARRRTWSGRTRASCTARTRRLATRTRQVLVPAVGSRTHGPPTCPADRAVHATVKQRPCSQALSRSTRTPVASPAGSCVGGRSPLRPPHRRDVLPAPPLGGAPRLPRPSSAHHREGVLGWTSETLDLSVC